MTNNPLIDTDGLNDEQIIEYSNICNQLEEKFHGKIKNDIEFNIERFETFKHYDSVSILNNVEITNGTGTAQILFTSVIYKFSGNRGGINFESEDQVYGYTILRNDLGQVLIRRKRFLDKIYELFDRREIKFKDDIRFSNAFYVLGSERDRVLRHINSSFRTILMDCRLKDYYIEILGNELIIGNKKPVDPDIVFEFSKLILKLTKV